MWYLTSESGVCADILKISQGGNQMSCSSHSEHEESAVVVNSSVAESHQTETHAFF